MMRTLVVERNYTGLALSEDGKTIHSGGQFQVIAREWQLNPDLFKLLFAMRREGWLDIPREKSTKGIKIKIRNGLRLALQGIEELWGLPRSFETKKEQGRRK